jgi:hypothetical protein
VSKQRLRQVLALLFAALAGLALGLLDSSPGFDATGITAGGLIVGGAASALLDGSGALGWATLYALLLVLWILVIESATAPTAAVALVFSVIGSLGAALLLRLREPSVHGT